MSAGETRFAKFGHLKVEIHRNRQLAGEAAAQEAARVLRKIAELRETFGVVFATGASQLATLDALARIPQLPWSQVRGFHMDEYVNLPESHPASFRGYLREHLTQQKQMASFLEIDGNASDIDQVCRSYADQLKEATPQLCLLGIGENGHLAFNDPGEADFEDSSDVRLVRLDRVCREQQAAEGWFRSYEDVPEMAVTLTIPAILRIPKLIVSVPDKRKATVVRRTLEEPISTSCPSTILRTHPDVTVYLDEGSAEEIKGLMAQQPEMVTPSTQT